MSWSLLGAQFCLELSFGVLVALAFVPKAPVGTLFYRLMGSSAMVLGLVALGLLLRTEGASWSQPSVLAAALAMIGYPLYSGPLRGWRWGAGLAWSMVATAAAVVLILRRTLEDPGGVDLALASYSALSTGAVAGSVGLAMVLGHWYLTVPNLNVSHLSRLNRVTVGAMLSSLLGVGLTVVWHREAFELASTPLLGPWGMFYFGTRLTVGLFLPLLFAWMTAGSLKFKNTRSATGILYASTVLVLIGTAVSVSLQSSYKVPL